MRVFLGNHPSMIVKSALAKEDREWGMKYVQCLKKHDVVENKLFEMTEALGRVTEELGDSVGNALPVNDATTSTTQHDSFYQDDPWW